MSLTSKACANRDVNRSWADIVKGSDAANCSENGDADSIPDRQSEGSASEPQQSECMQPSAHKTFKPGGPGARTCLCYGRLLVMLAHYGWIEARGTIDHPDAQKNGGRIYVHRRDLAGEVKEGQIVCFYLYVDEKGLGAEYCQAALACDLKKIGPLSTDLKEFALAAFRLREPTGFNVHAPVFLPPASRYSKPELGSEIDEVDGKDIMPDMRLSPNLNPEAAEFVPTCFEQHYSSPPVRLAVSSLELTSPAAVPMRTSYGEAMCAHIANFFCDDSDDDSDEELHLPCSVGVGTVRSKSMLDGHAKKAQRAASSNDSTSGGDSSDSDSYGGDGTWTTFACTRPPPGLCLQELPPGLCLPPGLPVPPGLALPVLGGMCAAK